jgi:RNA polymerase II subunit A small phosphatase-like protein
MYPDDIKRAELSGFIQDMDDCDFHILDVFPALERPFVHKFLHWAFRNFTVGIWSSATQDYVDDFVVKMITDPQHGEVLFAYARDRCVKAIDYRSMDAYGSTTYEYVKDLRKLKKFGFPIEHIIAVDDTPEKLQRQYGNLVRVLPFLGNPADTEMLKLMSYLETLKTVPNVRTVEKRGWSQMDK